MQYHGNKTLNQSVFKGYLQYDGNKTLYQRVFKGIERNIMERRL